MATAKTAETKEQTEKKDKLKTLEGILTRVILNGFSSYFQVIDISHFQKYGIDFSFLKDEDAQLLMDRIGVSSYEEFKGGKAVAFKLDSNVVESNRSARIKQQGGDHPFYKPHFYNELLDVLEGGENSFLVGPTGCGKTTMSKLLANDLGRNFYRMSMNGEATIDNFLGSVHLTNKETHFVPGILPTAMEEGAVLLLDEVDSGQPEVLFLLHPALERNPEIVLHDDKSRVVKAKKGFCVIGAANTLGKGDETGNYSGTNILNEAFLDRFSVTYHMEYSAHEKEIMKHYVDDDRMIERVLSFSKDVRQAMEEGKSMTTMSTRRMIDLVKKASVWGLYKAFNAVILSRVPGDDREVIKSYAVKHHLLTKTAEKEEL